MEKVEDIYLQEFHPDLINPNMNTKDEREKGMKIFVIGKPGSGKSTLIKYLLYCKRNIIPVGMAISGTEIANKFYQKFMPNTFVFNKYNEEHIKAFKSRQILSVKHLKNNWGVCVVDDCIEDRTSLNSKIQKNFLKMGRHWNMLYIIGFQYCVDIEKGMRASIDGVFIFREPNMTMRKTLYENYASIIPSFDIFNSIMDQIVGDYTCLYIHNMTQNNDWKKCIFWCKAQKPPDDFKFGCPQYWEFHMDKYNPEYVDDIMDL